MNQTNSEGSLHSQLATLVGCVDQTFHQSTTARPRYPANTTPTVAADLRNAPARPGESDEAVAVSLSSDCSGSASNVSCSLMGAS